MSLSKEHSLTARANPCSIGTKIWKRRWCWKCKMRRETLYVFVVQKENTPACGTGKHTFSTNYISVKSGLKVSFNNGSGNKGHFTLSQGLDRLYFQRFMFLMATCLLFDKVTRGQHFKSVNCFIINVKPNQGKNILYDFAHWKPHLVNTRSLHLHSNTEVHTSGNAVH